MKFNLNVVSLLILGFGCWFILDTVNGYNDTRKTRDSGTVKEIVCDGVFCRAKVDFKNTGERNITLHSVALIGDYIIEECTEQYRFLDPSCRFRFIGE